MRLRILGSCLLISGVFAAVAITQASACEVGASTDFVPERASGHWTLRDIVTVPHVVDVAISNDGRDGAYVAFQADMTNNRQRACLYLVDVAKKSVRQAVTAGWMQDLRPLPAGGGWSVLADFGDGEQLYRIGPDGSSEVVVANSDTVLVGKVDGAVDYNATDAPRRIGILAYSWSPDGESLWYVVARPAPDLVNTLFDDAAWRAGLDVPRRMPMTVEFRVRYSDGDDVLIDARPAEDHVVYRTGFHVEWADDGSGLRYSFSRGEPGALRQETYTWSDVRGSLDVGGAPRLTRAPRDPSVGELAVALIGQNQLLQENFAGGRNVEHQPIDFVVADPRASKGWVAPMGERIIVGVRFTEPPRYGLVVLDREHGQNVIAVEGSLTNCAIDGNGATGLCVRQSMTHPPELVRLDLHTGLLSHILSLAPAHEAIVPLRVESQTWIGEAGFSASGFVTYPRDYRPGTSYPAIIITHGSDADERFVSHGFQWEYPAQVFAEQGYFVVAVNDPVSSQTEELAAAYDAWSGKGDMPPALVQDLIWITGVRCFEAAIAQLADQGLVDPSRVGIAGYSRGSQMVNVAMTQSSLFVAGSSGDGGYLEPAGYFATPTAGRSYDAVFGGSPYADEAFENYRRLSPTFRAEHASGALLQQVAELRPGVAQLHSELRRHGKPTQISLYAGEDRHSRETHLFHLPANRLAAMQENLDWFNFWLRGFERPDPAMATTYSRWRRLRDDAAQ